MNETLRITIDIIILSLSYLIAQDSFNSPKEIQSNMVYEIFFIFFFIAFINKNNDIMQLSIINVVDMLTTDFPLANINKIPPSIIEINGIIKSRFICIDIPSSYGFDDSFL